MIQKIEQERQKLNGIAERYGLSHPRVLAQSQHLDKLLNLYQRTQAAHPKRKKEVTDRTDRIRLSG